MDGAAGYAQTAALKTTAWSEGVPLSSRVWEQALWEGANSPDLAETQGCQCSVAPDQRAGPGALRGWCSWPAGCERPSARFLKEPGRIRCVCNLRSKQTVCSKYTGYIVFLALFHWFNNVLFGGEIALSLLAWKRNPREILCWTLC